MKAILLGQKKILFMQYISGLRLLTCPRSNFNHLNEHKFRHNSNDLINPMCCCDFEPETADHYLVRCKLFTDLKLDLLNDIYIYNINQSLKNLSEKQLVNILLFDFKNYTLDENTNILECKFNF